MPKIVHINTVADPRNGVGGIIDAIHSRSSERGWESYVLAGRTTASMIGGAVAVGGTFGLYVNALLSRINDNEGCNAVGTTVRMLRELDRIGPDVVHLHNLHGYYLNVPMFGRWLRRNDVPAVMTLHDRWMMTGHCCYLPDGGCELWIDGCTGKCGAYGSYPASWHAGDTRGNLEMKLGLLGSARRVILVSPSHQLDYDVTRSKFKAFRHIVIHNGVDTGVFHPAGPKRAGKPLIVGVVNVWDENKNPEVFNRLAEDLGGKVDIMLVGRMDRPMNAAIDCRGKICSAEELAEVYRMASVVVNASRSESFGMVTAEAIACGTPVVINSSQKMDELIGGGCGLSVDCNDRMALAAAVADAMALKPVLPGHLSADVMAGRYYDEYSELISRK